MEPSSDPLKWPTKGNNLFPNEKANIESPTWCALNWISDFASDESFYAAAFKKAGDKIIAELKRGEDPEHPDPMFIPTAFLYRHSLELKLKSVVRKGLDLEIVSLAETETKNILGGHNLDVLWRQFKAIAVAHQPNAGTKDLAAAEKIAQDFHALDISGQHLRYPHDKKGNRTSATFPDSLELTDFKDKFEGTYNFLDCCEMEFSHCLEIKSEIESEHREESFPD